LFDAAQAFPVAAPFSIPRLGLMMASDDARHLQELLIIAREKAADALPAEQSILNGKIGHLFRLLCGHLHEAKEVFLDLENKAPGLVDAAIGQDAEQATGVRRETASIHLRAAGVAVRPPGRWGHPPAKPAKEVSTDLAKAASRSQSP
jgi:hypothetical protein